LNERISAAGCALVFSLAVTVRARGNVRRTCLKDCRESLKQYPGGCQRWTFGKTHGERIQPST
jgi:hypothetical protein